MTAPGADRIPPEIPQAGIQAMHAASVRVDIVP